MNHFFQIPAGKITVIAPPIGVGFGGKAGIQLEALAYLLSKAVNGRPVKLVNTRVSPHDWATAASRCLFMQAEQLLKQQMML